MHHRSPNTGSADKASSGRPSHLVIINQHFRLQQMVTMSPSLQRFKRLAIPMPLNDNSGATSPFLRKADMGPRFFVAILLLGFLHAAASAGGSVRVPFVDGIWHGDIATHPDGLGFKECWASTSFADGTTLTLAEQRDENWSIRLSNPEWQWSPSSSNAMIVQVDFYPRLEVEALASSNYVLEFKISDDKTLLEFVENGHSFKLSNGDFNKEYNLEGSAKIIQRIRNCVSEQLAGER